jgi:hypothetical protein
MMINALLANPEFMSVSLPVWQQSWLRVLCAIARQPGHHSAAASLHCGEQQPEAHILIPASDGVLHHAVSSSVSNSDCTHCGMAAIVGKTPRIRPNQVRYRLIRAGTSPG